MLATSQRAKTLNFPFLLDQKLRSNDEDGLKITQTIQSCVNRFAQEKAKKFKQGTWITCKIKNQMRRRNNLFQRMICSPTEKKSKNQK